MLQFHAWLQLLQFGGCWLSLPDSQVQRKRSKLNQIDLIVVARLRNLAGELGAVAKMHEQMVRVEVRMVLGLRFLCWHQQATAAGCNRVCWRSRGNK